MCSPMILPTRYNNAYLTFCQKFDLSIPSSLESHVQDDIMNLSTIGIIFENQSVLFTIMMGFYKIFLIQKLIHGTPQKKLTKISW